MAKTKTIMNMGQPLEYESANGLKLETVNIQLISVLTPNKNAQNSKNIRGWRGAVEVGGYHILTWILNIFKHLWLVKNMLFLYMLFFKLSFCMDSH